MSPNLIGQAFTFFMFSFEFLGFHTYCFKPALENIPDGDWYCYECVNKATNLKHCLVCGKMDGKNLILCITCPRAYHTSCLSPALSKVCVVWIF